MILRKSCSTHPSVVGCSSRGARASSPMATFATIFATTTLAITVAVIALSLPRQADAFSYIFANEINGTQIVSHPTGYNPAVGGVLNVTVGIDMTSANAGLIEISTQNVIDVWNAKVATTQNLSSGIGNSQFDFESVLLHEMGHSLGLGHVNAATESFLGGNNRNYTKATEGANNTYDINSGADGVIGSHDDIRGDDVNLNWFHRATNDPFDIANVSGVVDVTTYSVLTTNLPFSDTFSTNGDRTVSGLARYGQANTESAMQQGTFSGETQRTLVADDVAGIRYAEAGLDELAGTADDYTLHLIYVGQVASGSADIVIDFDNGETGFAVSQSGGVFISEGPENNETFFNADNDVALDPSGNILAGGGSLYSESGENPLDVNLGDQATHHISISSSSIYFNTGFNWFYNQTRLVPEPSSVALLLLSTISVLCGTGRQRRR